MTKPFPGPAFFLRWRSDARRRVTIRNLAKLDDHLLQDIGVSRGDLLESLRTLR